MSRCSPRVLVFEHMAAGHSGIFGRLMAEAGIERHAVRLDLGQPVPALAEFEALVVMGGPMDVWQEAAHPWLVAEKRVIREAVREHAMSFLGICLGHQLLAEALGGEVGPSAAPEIGAFEVTLTMPGRHHPLLRGQPERLTALQWHAAEVVRLPPDAEVLAASDRCAVQALAIGEQALGLQCHLEVDAPTLSQWLAVPENRTALEMRLGPGGLARFAAEARAHMAASNRMARRLFESWHAQIPLAGRVGA